MDNLIIVLAKYFIIVPVLIAAVVFLHLHGKWRQRYVVTLILGAVVSYVLAKVGSHLYYDPRPFVQGGFTPLLSHANDNGFPSDHTLLAAAIGWCSLFYSKKAGIVALASAALIGAARMAAGVHHFVDVLGSIAIAALGCYLAYYLTLKLLPIKQSVETRV